MWLSKKPPCIACKEIWERKEENPPCDTCAEELFEENEDAVKIYFAVQDQIIIAGDKVVGLSVPAIKIMMDLHKVKNQKDCLEKVRKLFDFFKNEGG